MYLVPNITKDGSFTIYNELVGESYHSVNGAYTESRHVFVRSGLEYLIAIGGVSKINLLEVGFGTGLNFLLTADFLRGQECCVRYQGVEPFPLSIDQIEALGYNNLVDDDVYQSFIKVYASSLNNPKEVFTNVSLEVSVAKLQDFKDSRLYNLVYFDAFSVMKQPELWTLDSLMHVANKMPSNGVFVTYSVTGELKRNLKSIGFCVEKIAGPPGKREILRAVRI